MNVSKAASAACLVSAIQMFCNVRLALACRLLVQDIRGFMHPATLRSCLRPHLVDRLPEAERPVSDGELRVHCQATPLEIEQQLECCDNVEQSGRA
jgi:hypothetical protein